MRPNHTSVDSVGSDSARLGQPRYISGNIQDTNLTSVRCVISKHFLPLHFARILNMYEIASLWTKLRITERSVKIFEVFTENARKLEFGGIR